MNEFVHLRKMNELLLWEDSSHRRSRRKSWELHGRRKSWEFWITLTFVPPAAACPQAKIPMNVCVLNYLNKLHFRGHPSYEVNKYSTREACGRTCKSRGSLVFSYYKNKNYHGKNYNECRCGAKGRDLHYMTTHEAYLHKGRSLSGALQRCDADDVSTLKWCTCSTALPLPCRFEKKCHCPAVTKGKRYT